MWTHPATNSPCWWSSPLPLLLPQLHKNTSSNFSAGLSQAPQWGTQEPSSPATCDHCPRPTMLQFPDALGVPPVPQGQCGTKHQGKLTRAGWRDGNTFIPVGCSYLNFPPSVAPLLGWRPPQCGMSDTVGRRAAAGLCRSRRFPSGGAGSP